MKAAREMIEGMEREKATRMSVRNAFGMDLGKNLQRSGLQNVTLRTRRKSPKYQTTRKTGGYAHA
jgi:hypothetical protein